MAGIKIDTEWLARYSDELRASGAEVGAARRELDAVTLDQQDFGDWEHAAGAVEAYTRLAEFLRERTAHLGAVLAEGGDELRRVADIHVEGDLLASHEEG